MGDDHSDSPRLGGWLVFPPIGLLISSVISANNVRHMLSLLKPSTWAAITSDQSIHFLWIPTVVFELSTSAVMAVFAVVLLVLYLKRRRCVPRLMMSWMVLALTVHLVDYGLGRAISDSDVGPTAMQAASPLLETFIIAAIWIPYFAWNHRVKVTFVK